MNLAEEVLRPALERGQGADPALLSDGTTVTYAELNERIYRAAHAFRSAGMKPADRALMLVCDAPAFYYAFLGLARIGAVPIPLNLRLAPADLAFTIDDSGAKLLFIDRQFMPIYEEIAGDLSDPPRLIMTDGSFGDAAVLSDLMADASSEPITVDRDADDPAFWLYSSGTTGKPKGVVHRQGMIVGAENFIGKMHGVGPGDRLFCSSKLFFAYSLAHCLFASLRLGACSILYADWPDPNAITAVVERYKPTVMLSVPTFYRNLLRDGAAEKPAYKQIKSYISAGEKLPKSLFDRWQSATGRPLYDGIGASETCFLFLANGRDAVRGGTCGKPTPQTEVKLVDLEGNTVSGTEASGILWVRMPSVAAHYWNLDDLSREVFRDGWYCTNDMFSRDAEGWYEHQGRADDMLKISGQWVSPLEIEEHVLHNPKVADAAVVGVPNEDGLIRLALFVVAPDAEGDHEGFEKELKDALTAELAIYKCPRRVFYLDSMPVTGTGKLQRFQLREMAIARQAELVD